MWLASYVVGLLIFVFIAKRKKTSSSWREIFFPRQIYRHSSALDDVLITVTSLSLGALAVAKSVTVQAGIATVVAGGIYNLVVYGLDFNLQFSPLNVWAYTLGLALVLDFAVFYAHRLMHKVNWLWSFHKVHHSALVLTPLTQMRFHPLEDLFMEAFSGLTLGIFLGLGHAVGLVNGFQGDFESLWLVYLIFNLTSHFRHSHIWISFGPIFSFVFSSPAMHQIHHSHEARHIDKNFATVFSFWDWIFGSIYIPKEREHFAIGLRDAKDQSNYQGWKGLMLSPFQDTLDRMKSIFAVKAAEKGMNLPPKPTRPLPSRY